MMINKNGRENIMKKYDKNITMLTYNDDDEKGFPTQPSHVDFVIDDNDDEIFHDDGTCNLILHNGSRMIISYDLFKSIHNEYEKMLQNDFDDNNKNIGSYCEM